MAEDNKYTFSFITVSLNNSKGLDLTLSSISEFKDENIDLSIEVVVIDGGSIDGSKMIFEKYINLIDVLVIEKDEGIYDAMTKGIKVTTGDFVCFMNTGDQILKKGMRKLIHKIDNKDYSFAGSSKWDIRKRGQNYLKFYPKLLRMPNHQAIWFSRNFLVENPFDKRFPVCADLDHKILCNNNKTLRRFDIEVVLSESGGASQVITTAKVLFARALEHAGVAKKHYGNFWFFINFVKFYIWNLRKVIKEKVAKYC
jgi:glycosyltransferase involved in cell wall biosynthesis